MREGQQGLRGAAGLKSSINACRQKVVWELGIEFCQNDSETTESTREARTAWVCATWDAEALCFVTEKEAKATHAHTIWEAKAQCSTAIRDVETQGASQADSLHR